MPALFEMYHIYAVLSKIGSMGGDHPPLNPLPSREGKEKDMVLSREGKEGKLIPSSEWKGREVLLSRDGKES